ncbi:MAG: methyltransferase domain-containing protein, partial [Rhodobacteraceae bacterium]|nr:methyltransferase domain-containing protein [Paracoccaceae bacterium]
TGALRPEDLKPVDSLHLGGWQATEALLAQLDIAPGAQALDIGCGIGGTVRELAVQHGADAWGVDLTPEFVAAAETLSRMAGVTGVSFAQGSAVALPFPAERFDLATLLHVGMNVPDKAAMFAEAARVLRPGGVFAIYDVMRVGEGALGFPMPWAGTAAISFVEAPDIYAELGRAAGFRETARRERAALGIAFLEALQGRGPARAAMPEDRLANALDALRGGVLAPVELILRRN